MEVFITLIIIMVFIFIWVINSTRQKTKKTKQDTEQRYKNENIKQEFKLYHLSGYPFPNFINHFKIKNDNTFFINDNKILIENILRIESKTKEQLEKDITIPRILIGGIFALAKPKKTVIKTEYLYLSYLDSGIQIDCLFEGYPNTNLGNLSSIINQLRIQKNKELNFSNEKLGEESV